METTKETTFSVAQMAKTTPTTIIENEVLGIKFKATMQDLHYDKEKGYNFSMGFLLSNISIENKNSFYIYGTKQSDLMVFSSGQWKQVPKEVFGQLIRRLIRNTIIKLGHKGNCYISQESINQVVDSLICQMEEFPSMNEIQSKINDGTYKIITNNKVIKISMDGTIEQEMNFGQYFNFISLNDFNINDNELPEEIKDFFKSITLNDQSYINYLQELMGHCMLYGHAQEPYIYMLLGSGKNGKSIFIELLKMLVNLKVCAINFSDIKEVNAELLESNFINLPSELDGDSPMNEAMLKQITSGDSIMANPKYRDPRTIIPIAKQIAAMNKLPLIKDGSDGIWRRIQVLPFNLVITKSMQKDPNYFKNIFNKNIDAIRNWAFKGLIRLLKNKGTHTHCNIIQQATNKYRIDENIPLQFLDNVRQELSNLYVSKKKQNTIQIDNIEISFKTTQGDDTKFKLFQDDIYKGYKIWCSDYGYKSANKKNFLNKIDDGFLQWLDIDFLNNKKCYAIDILELVMKKSKEIPIVFEEENPTIKEREEATKDMSFEEKASYYESLFGAEFLANGGEI